MQACHAQALRNKFAAFLMPNSCLYHCQVIVVSDSGMKTDQAPVHDVLLDVHHSSRAWTLPKCPIPPPRIMFSVLVSFFPRPSAHVGPDPNTMVMYCCTWLCPGPTFLVSAADARCCVLFAFCDMTVDSSFFRWFFTFCFR